MRVAALFFIAWLFASCEGSGDRRPNIIFIMTDDQGYQAISAYGSGLNSTPSIDRIANEGVIFRNSFVCNSISAPSRAALLTGKHSHANGQTDNRTRFDSTQVTFPCILQKAGYQTALIGKWHLQSEPAGFDFWSILPGQGSYYNPDFIEKDRRYREQGYVTNIITDKAIDWLRHRDQEKPFCLMVHHKAPHRNWMPDSVDFDLYDGRSFPVPANYFDDYSGREGAALQKMSVYRDMHMAFDLKITGVYGDSVPPMERDYINYLRNRLTPEQYAAWSREYGPVTEKYLSHPLSGDSLAVFKLNRYLTDYLRTIASVDRNTGRLLDYIDSAGLGSNTLIVFTSDQGFYMGEHGWFDKRFMYEESFRTPLVMRLPDGYRARGDISQMVQNIDLAPTFLEMAGVRPPEEMQGMSMVPILRGGKVSKWRDALYYQYYEYPGEHDTRPHYGVRTERYKLIHFGGDIDEWELFDLASDPGEMNNLINDPAFDGIENELRARLVDLRKYYGVPDEK